MELSLLDIHLISNLNENTDELIDTGQTYLRESVICILKSLTKIAQVLRHNGGKKFILET